MVNRVIGCADLPHGIGWDRYFGKVSFLETSALTRGAVRPSVLTKWRAAAPGAGAFAVVAPPMVPEPLGVERGTESLIETLRALEASLVVVRTPPSFSPSAANRELLRRYFGEVLVDVGVERVWQPDGLWDTRTALKLAGELGVILGADPLVRDPTKEPVDFYSTLETDALYCRVTGLGRGARILSSSQLDELSMVTEAYERTWVVLATVDSFADASRFAKLLGDQK
jgi:hypothetical protein